MTEEAVDGQEAVAEDAETEEVKAQEEAQENTEAEDQDVEYEADEGEGDEEESEEVSEIEFDFGGNKLTLPANASAEEVAAKVQEFSDSLNKGYQKKFSDVAERTKSLEAREKAVEKLQTLNADVLDTYSRGLSLRQEIEQLSQIDVNALWQSDPDRARRVSDQLSLKQSEFQSIVNQVRQKEGELTKAQQEEMSRRVSEGEAAIERQVKGFKAEKLPEVIDYAVNTLGMDKESAERDWALNPAITLAVWKAAQFDKMQAQAKSKAKPKPAPAQAVTAPKPKGNAKRSYDLVKDADKMSADEWARRRNQQLAKKRA